MTTDAPLSPATPTADHITTSSRDPHELAARLQQWLHATLGCDRAPSISDVSSPEGNGMSSETLLFTARWLEADVENERRLVARIEPPASDHPIFTTYDLDMQFRVMRLVGEHTSVPVPRTLWFEPDPAILGGPFFVMERIDGLVPPDVLPYTFEGSWLFEGSASDRQTLQTSAIEAMAGIHSITPDRFDLDFLHVEASGDTALERLLDRWKSYHSWVIQDTPSPVLQEGFAWLEDNLPTDVGADALAWGDGRIGNMMFEGNRVVAVLDWEMASVAPPEVDLGWMCYLHRFFHDIAVDLGATGLPEMFRPVDVAETYAKASGTVPGDLTWHMMFAAVRHGAIMRRVSERAIQFGEAVKPDDIDDLIIHRATLRAMLDGEYWSHISF